MSVSTAITRTDCMARLGALKALRSASTPLRGAGGLDRASVSPSGGSYVMAGDECHRHDVVHLANSKGGIHAQ